jgi:hypothetical protein
MASSPVVASMGDFTHADRRQAGFAGQVLGAAGLGQARAEERGRL